MKLSKYPRSYFEFLENKDHNLTIKQLKIQHGAKN